MNGPSDDMDEALLDYYVAGDGAAILEAEYARLVAVAARFSERQARWAVGDAPTAVEIVSRLAVEALPNGPAPSLSDALHALDEIFGSWQAEPTAFQRVQGRRLAFASGQLAMLRAALGTEAGAGE